MRTLLSPRLIFYTFPTTSRSSISRVRIFYQHDVYFSNNVRFVDFMCVNIFLLPQHSFLTMSRWSISRVRKFFYHNNIYFPNNVQFVNFACVFIIYVSCAHCWFVCIRDILVYVIINTNVSLGRSYRHRQSIAIIDSPIFGYRDNDTVNNILIVSY